MVQRRLLSTTAFGSANSLSVATLPGHCRAQPNQASFLSLFTGMLRLDGSTLDTVDAVPELVSVLVLQCKR